ncbi:MAG: S-layer homology domain-containing protein [Myxococcales bacterium]|nr:S-layer homology domain-containing protein [Myxococcales bacterium]
MTHPERPLRAYLWFVCLTMVACVAAPAPGIDLDAGVGDASPHELDDAPTPLDPAETTNADAPEPPVLDEIEVFTASRGVLRDIAGHAAAHEIEFLFNREIISGFPDGTFQPNAAVTRAQFAAMVTNAFARSVTPSATSFRDVPASHWASTAIRRAHAAGFMRGYPEGDFRPDQTITRVEVVVALANGLRLAGGSWALTENHYDDAGDVAGWARGAVANGDQAGFFANLPLHAPAGTLLRPTTAASRAHVASYVFYALFATANWGVATARDVTSEVVVASRGTQTPFFACVDGVVYGVAAGFAAAGLASLWTAAGATGVGALPAAAASAPVVGFIGGSVGIAVAGWGGCFAPLARLAWNLIHAGWDQMGRGIRALAMSRARTFRCRCSFRNAPAGLNHCPDRVTGVGVSNHDCNNAARDTAPRECRQYYGHCNRIP